MLFYFIERLVKFKLIFKWVARFMLVQEIVDFLEKLKQHNLNSVDVTIRNSFIVKFSQRATNEPLTVNDINFICEHFRRRSHAIHDKSDDYTLNPAGVNQLWIELAEKIAPYTNKDALHLLLPFVTNTLDLNSNKLTLLSKIHGYEYYYFGEDGVTLYTKRGLCSNLRRHNYKLCTHRDLVHTKKLCAVTIDELARMQACKQPKGDFSINDEHFGSFWDFLERKVFVCLQRDRMGLPENITLSIKNLINNYFTLKASHTSFTLFKKSFREFLTSLYQSKLEQINFFYGEQVRCNSKVFYLFELLIAIRNANTYNIDALMHSLNEWTNSRSNIHASDNNSGSYNEVPGAVSTTSTSSSMTGQEETLRMCYTVLISLLTKEFSYYPVTGTAVSVWDKSNFVTQEVYQVYNALYPHLLHSKPEALCAAYQHAIEDIVLPACNDNGWLTWLWRLSDTDVWLKQVAEGRLNTTGVHYYEPASLLKVLTENTYQKFEMDLITKFTDSLIHTFTQQKQGLLLKNLRVNILFVELMKSLSEPTQAKICNNLAAMNTNTAKREFVADAKRYISKRLSLIGGLPLCNGESIHQGTQSTQFFPPEQNGNQLAGLLNAFKAVVAQLNPATNKCKKLQEQFLFGITVPILTYEEEEQINRRSQEADRINAPT